MAASPSRTTDNKSSVLLITLIYWLLIARVIIPGMGDYGENVDVLKVAARDALFNKITWISFLLIPVIMISSRWPLSSRVLKANQWFLVLLAFAALSIAWSIASGPSINTFIRAITIVLACLAAVVVGWNPKRVQQLTRPILTMMLLGSIIFGLVSPELAITAPIPPDTKYYWKGLATQKNGLGSLASLGAIFWFHAWASREVKQIPALLGLGISVTCLVLARSSTALMSGGLACIFLTLMLRTGPALKPYRPYIVGFFVAFTVAYSFAVLKVLPGFDILLKPIAMLTGKDGTFTDRTRIWELMHQHIAQSPIIGTGYGGFWIGPTPSSPSFIFLRVMYFYPSMGHNGYLDIINDLGYVGLMLLVGYLLTYVRQALRVLPYDFPQAALYLAVLFQQLLSNLSETHWLFIGHDYIVLTLCTVGLSRSLLESTQRVAAPVPVRREVPNVPPKRNGWPAARPLRSQRRP